MDDLRRRRGGGLLLALLDRLLALLAAERKLLLPERHLRGVLADYWRQVGRGNRRMNNLRRLSNGGLLLALLDRLVALLAAERELLLPERHLRGVRADYWRQVGRGNRRMNNLRRLSNGGLLLALLDRLVALLAA